MYYSIIFRDTPNNEEIKNIINKFDILINNGNFYFKTDLSINSIYKIINKLVKSKFIIKEEKENDFLNNFFPPSKKEIDNKKKQILDEVNEEMVTFLKSVENEMQRQIEEGGANGKDKK